MGMGTLKDAMRPRAIPELVQERHPPGSYSHRASLVNDDSDRLQSEESISWSQTLVQIYVLPGCAPRFCAPSTSVVSGRVPCPPDARRGRAYPQSHERDYGLAAVGGHGTRPDDDGQAIALVTMHNDGAHPYCQAAVYSWAPPRIRLRSLSGVRRSTSGAMPDGRQ